MFKNIIFDWSGVVKDAVGAQVWVVNKIFQKFNANPVSLDELKENWIQPHMLFYNKYLPSLSKEDQDSAYKYFITGPDYPKCVSFPGMVDFIKVLKNQGNYLAIVSSDLPESLLKEIIDYGLDNIFDDIVTNVHDKEEGVKILMEKKGLDKNNTYFIGDSNHEIEVSRSAGIKSIAVTWGFATEKNLRLENPDFMVHDIKELEEILLA